MIELVADSRFFFSVGEGMTSDKHNPWLSKKSIAIAKKLFELFPAEIGMIYRGTGIRHWHAIASLGSIETTHVPVFGTETFYPFGGNQVRVDEGFMISKERYHLSSDCIDRTFKGLSLDSIVVGDLAILNLMGIIQTSGGISDTSPLIVQFKYEAIAIREVRVITLSKPHGVVFYPKVAVKTGKANAIMD